MRILLAIAALVMSLSFTPSAAAWSETDEAQATGDRIVCKERKKTGTRFTTKTCRTVAQWEKMAEENRAGLREMVDRPKILTCGPSGCGG